MDKKNILEQFHTPDSQRTYNQLYGALHSETDAESLQQAIDELVAEGKLKESYLVIGPSGHGLESYENRDEIPDTLEDDRFEGDMEEEIVTFEVTPGRIQTVYHRVF